MKSIPINIDKVAISLSLICTVHCLLLPLAFVLLPALAANTFADERLHQWMLLAVLPTSLIALTMGCRQHLKFSVMAMGLTGLCILTLATFMGHDLLGETGEKIAILMGASLIALGHLRNHTLCKRLQCGCEAH
ncbi:MAG: MerC domain-containing protein [Gammaproteobacteria bacterium]|nr:MerC domain-containing protein [Gammaproteobacteria bacterium]MBQ0839375.1 MerC domain-containing protein [Gammaproteobacteria bacterium]